MPDALAGLAASAALAVSDIPFYNLFLKYVLHVLTENSASTQVRQLEKFDIDMMIGASLDSVAMVEGEMKEISEAEMVEAIKFAHEAIKVQIHASIAFTEALAKKKCVLTKVKKKTKKFTQK
jgi:polyribonucleotide nucleotidyltransferase